MFGFHSRRQYHVDPYASASITAHFTQTVLWRIWSSMIIFTGIAVLLCCLDRTSSNINLGIPPTMLTVLGTVIGFTISYRTTSAYERYIEGRKLWQSVQVATRSFSRLIWMHCPDTLRKEAITDPGLQAEDTAKALLEKKTALNLLEAFAVALKHYLRGETGVHYEDLYHLIAFLPKYNIPSGTPIHRGDLPVLNRNQSTSGMLTADTSYSSDKLVDKPEEQLGQNRPHLRFRSSSSGKDQAVHKVNGRPIGPRNPDKPLLPAHNPPPFNFIDDVVPSLAPLRSLFKFGRRHVNALLDDEAEERRKKKRKHKKDIYSGSNIPCELLMHLSAFIAAVQKRGTVDGPTASALLACNAMLGDSLSGLERVLTTPIPYSYAIHLKHTAYIYLLFLPFQMLPTLGWLTIPATTIAAFVFLGFLEIGDQIEQPLGYDSSDLDMGMFASNIRKELRELATMPAQDCSEMFLHPMNEPLAPHDVRSASELVEACVSKDEIHDALRRGHEAHYGMSRSYTAIQRTRSSSSMRHGNPIAMEAVSNGGSGGNGGDGV